MYLRLLFIYGLMSTSEYFDKCVKHDTCTTVSEYQTNAVCLQNYEFDG